MPALLVALLVGCGAMHANRAFIGSDPDPLADRCRPTACGGTGDTVLPIGLVGIGVLVGVAAVRELWD